MDARARVTRRVVSLMCPLKACSFTPAPHRKKSLYVNKAAKTTLYSHKGSFLQAGLELNRAGREGYGFFAFFCWPALSTDLYDRAESTDASDKTDNMLM